MQLVLYWCTQLFSQGHLQYAAQAVTFIVIMERKYPFKKSRLSDLYDKQVQQNTKGRISTIDVIQFLIKQGLALKGMYLEEQKEGEWYLYDTH